MLSLFFLRKIKFDLGQSLGQGHFYAFLHIFRPKKRFLHIFTHFHNESNIFTLFQTSRRPKCHSDIPRTPSPMSSHQLHCHDYRDNVYIFMYTLYLYALCVSRPDTPNTVPFSVYAPLTRLTVRLVSLIRIRITYTFNVDAPLASPFNPFNSLYIYIILIHITYT